MEDHITDWFEIITEPGLRVTLATHLFQQLQLWVFEVSFCLLTVAHVLCIFLKSGLHISCKDRKHVCEHVF